MAEVFSWLTLLTFAFLAFLFVVEQSEDMTKFYLYSAFYCFDIFHIFRGTDSQLTALIFFADLQRSGITTLLCAYPAIKALYFMGFKHLN